MDYAPPMSTGPQEYASPPPEPVKKQRGCFFYGCLISVILLVLGIIAIALASYFTIRYVNNMAIEYTDTTAESIPPDNMPEADRKALYKRVVEDYFGDLKAGKATEPLVLTADDINALIDESPTFKGTVHVDIDGSKVKGKISYPIKNFPAPFTVLNGRFFNGSATLQVTLNLGTLVVKAEDIMVKGKPLPDAFAQSLQNQNLAKDATNDPKTREFFSHIESIEVKDGKFIITPKKAGAETEAEPEKKAAEKDAAEKDAPAKEAPAKDAPPEEAKPAPPAGEKPPMP